MAQSGVRFGTSGARGPVRRMTDLVCYAYTRAFLEYQRETGALPPAGGAVVLAGDLRPSTPRILAAAAQAARDLGLDIVHAGRVPSPALAWAAIRRGIPGVMVTGSHIPEDRNGIKFNRPDGEILKADEAAIRRRSVRLPAGRFDAAGAFRPPPGPLPPADPSPLADYLSRYLAFFPPGCLAGLRVGLYEHSCVGREVIGEALAALGAEVIRLGRTAAFVPVDTEAIRPEDRELARRWAREEELAALVSADGDADRPLMADEAGRWLRGDVAGILAARYLEADTVVTPVSSNTALERSGLFPEVRRTRIGSPYVIEGMLAAARSGRGRVVGYEANGGFLTASPIALGGRTLAPLPTRDALLVILCLLHEARRRRVPLSALAAELPPRFTASDRLRDFPPERSRAVLAALAPEGTAEAAAERALGDLFGPVRRVDLTDGVRLTFASGEIVHLRPSGNAPEFRCYTEADTEERAAELLGLALGRMEAWRGGEAGPQAGSPSPSRP
ncbi:phosphomannomutase [Dissulfurirhabdus thermomarina]|nr:phosphomannomutase [Dissulfurirhabdus thermomarina]